MKTFSTNYAVWYTYIILLYNIKPWVVATKQYYHKQFRIISYKSAIISCARYKILCLNFRVSLIQLVCKIRWIIDETTDTIVINVNYFLNVN